MFRSGVFLHENSLAQEKARGKPRGGVWFHNLTQSRAVFYRSVFPLSLFKVDFSFGCNFGLIFWDKISVLCSSGCPRTYYIAHADTEVKTVFLSLPTECRAGRCEPHIGPFSPFNTLNNLMGEGAFLSTQFCQSTWSHFCLSVFINSALIL